MLHNLQFVSLMRQAYMTDFFEERFAQQSAHAPTHTTCEVSVIDTCVELEADIIHPSYRINTEFLGDLFTEAWGKGHSIERVSFRCLNHYV